MNRIKPPPDIAVNFLSWTVPEHLKDAVLGDLAEEYQLRLLKDGSTKAFLWYWYQVLHSCAHFISYTQKGVVMFLLSVVVFIAVSCLGMVLGFSLSAYFDLVSCILVVFPALFFTVASTSLQALKQGFVILFNDKAEFSEQQCLSSKQSFNVLGNSALLMGAFSSLLGLIAIAGNTNFSITPERLGMAISVSLLTLYYGLGIKIICYVAEQKILHRLLKLKAYN